MGNTDFLRSPGYIAIRAWLKEQGRVPFDFQTEAWHKYSQGYSGLVNAPTGFGKTYSILLAVIIEHLNSNARAKGLQLLWITPLRSLAKDLARAMREVLQQLGLDWEVSVRNGDTPAAERARQKKNISQILLITPESLHLMLAQKKSATVFENLKCVVADEWHELLSTKRGVMVEFALSRIRYYVKQMNGASLRVWAISATIGNMAQALDVICPDPDDSKVIVKATNKKQIEILSILPEKIESLPWAGHLGLSLAEKLIPIIYKHKTVLVFVNTRGQAELWYQRLLDADPQLAGQLAIHHGSVDGELRNWIEDSLQAGTLKAVIATSSLDLGVDFKPVDTVVQIGSPKGVARFLQRAGRSGHSPEEVSMIYFLPTHALELVELSALRQAAKDQNIETREPLVMVYDTLVQYLVTLAVGDGFEEKSTFEQISTTHAFREINREEWEWVMTFISSGGDSLTAYNEFRKVVRDNDGLWKVLSRQVAMRHRLHIGTIVSDAMLRVKFVSGGYIGLVEESFVAKLKKGDTFTLAGRLLQYVNIREMTVMVKLSRAKQSVSPSWLGGRLPLSANLGEVLRGKYNEVLKDNVKEPELKILKPLFLKQKMYSAVPVNNQLLIEMINTRDGFHLFAYPFEGRLVHEILAALVAYRISRLLPISFSIAMNDYGFELLSDQVIPMDEAIAYDLFSPVNLLTDISLSINSTEMASRKFRDIACIAGLVFQGYPGKYVANKHLQASAGLFFKVFNDYDPRNLLLKQAYDEVFFQQLEEPRLFRALTRIQENEIIITYPERFTPLAFPIKVDSLRASMSSEELERKIKRMEREGAKA